MTPKKKKLTFSCSLRREKCQFPRFPSFQFCPIPKIENSEIWEICLFFQILTVVLDQDLKATKIWTEQKIERFWYDLKGKNKNFRDFRVFDFALYPRSKTRKSRKSCLPRILKLLVTQGLKTPKKWTETKTKRFRYDLEQNQKFSRFPSFRFCPIKIENLEI